MSGQREKENLHDGTRSQRWREQEREWKGEKENTDGRRGKDQLLAELEEEFGLWRIRRKRSKKN